MTEQQPNVESTIELLEKRDRRWFHLHFLHQHIPPAIATACLVGMVALAGLVTLLYAAENKRSEVAIVVRNAENETIPFVYGSWPALRNAQFFENVKDRFLSEKASFIEVDLSRMILRAYVGEEMVLETALVSKGKEGSWWETPAGLYSVQSKERKHYSSFGHVYMPWSMQFQGNFFIHGWPYQTDGTPVREGYSGGCVRLSNEDAEKLFALASVDMPVLVYEAAPESNAADAPRYEYKKPELGASAYLAADLHNNFVFAEASSSEPQPIASLTKLMTALVAVEYINVEREVTIDASMVASTSIPRLRPGSEASILDLLSLLLMESSNEAARAVAAPLGEKQFLSLMNAKASAIGMKGSRFEDTAGVLGANRATPEDLFMLAKYLYENRSFVLRMSVGLENRSAYGPSQFASVSNLNAVPGTSGLIGAKTGRSSSAGNTMLAVFDMNIDGDRRPVVIIVLGSENAQKDIAALFAYVQNRFITR
jgi:D-alanyl-D-alanine carboxypeptidase